MSTKFDNISAQGASAKCGSSLPGSPDIYYNVNTSDVDSVSWVGGELFYHTTFNQLYCQTETSGTTPVWKKLSDAFATTTSTSTSTSTTTSSSSSTTTSSSTSTSSSSTSTSTSTSTSSSTSTSTSTSSTTTMA